MGQVLLLHLHYYGFRRVRGIKDAGMPWPAEEEGAKHVEVVRSEEHKLTTTSMTCSGLRFVRAVC